MKTNIDDFKVKWEGTMKLYCDNNSAINIAYNLVRHDRTKHVKVDIYFIKEKLHNGLICTPYVLMEGQLIDILTKGLLSPTFHIIMSQMGNG